MKSRQFCSVCKQWLEMEVVPTSDGDDDDGVIWFRCPQCQGFLPKLGGADDAATGTEPVSAPGDSAAPAGDADSATDPQIDETMPWDSPAEMMAARRDGDEAAGPEVEDIAVIPEIADADLPAPPDGETTAVDGDSDKQAPPAEPIMEYAAMLADLDPDTAAPYRPWETYEIGQCILHLAWDDCGVVVAKENLPGGRSVIKCYFEGAGVVRLIENTPR